MRKILEEDYGFAVSEGKLSRLFRSIDEMGPELEGMLKEILIGTRGQPTAKNHDNEGGQNG